MGHGSPTRNYGVYKWTGLVATALGNKKPVQSGNDWHWQQNMQDWEITGAPKLSWRLGSNFLSHSQHNCAPNCIPTQRNKGISYSCACTSHITRFDMVGEETLLVGCYDTACVSVFCWPAQLSWSGEVGDRSRFPYETAKCRFNLTWNRREWEGCRSWTEWESQFDPCMWQVYTCDLRNTTTKSYLISSGMLSTSFGVV